MERASDPAFGTANGSRLHLVHGPPIKLPIRGIDKSGAVRRKGQHTVLLDRCQHVCRQRDPEARDRRWRGRPQTPNEKTDKSTDDERAHDQKRRGSQTHELRGAHGNLYPFANRLGQKFLDLEPHVSYIALTFLPVFLQTPTQKLAYLWSHGGGQQLPVRLSL